MNIKQITNYIQDGNPIIFNPGVKKISFCCEPKGIGRSIYIDGGEGLKPFEIGKTGMLEYQPEDFKDANDPDAETIEINPSITTVANLPTDIKWTLDYCI